jgi:outer membrane immunogenic protein
MRKLLLIVTSTVAMSSYATAADLEMATVGPEPYDWTGAYIGINAGVAFGDSTFETELTGDFLTDPNLAAYEASYPQELDNDDTDFTGGLTAGFNWQPGSLVFGVEGDINFLDSEESRFYDIDVIDTTLEHEIDWFATLRARLGFAADNLLFYITGGLAAGEVETSVDMVTIVPVYVWTGSSSEIEVGWTIGGGVEWALSDAWSIKGEYLWVDLGSDSYDLDNDPANPDQGYTIRAHSDTQFGVARIGVNLHF